MPDQSKKDAANCAMYMERWEKSEDWSRVVEELSNSRSVIRPNYLERAAGTNSTNELAIRNPRE